MQSVPLLIRTLKLSDILRKTKGRGCKGEAHNVQKEDKFGKRKRQKIEGKEKLVPNLSGQQRTLTLKLTF